MESIRTQGDEQTTQREFIIAQKFEFVQTKSLVF